MLLGIQSRYYCYIIFIVVTRKRRNKRARKRERTISSSHLPGIDHFSISMAMGISRDSIRDWTLKRLWSERRLSNDVLLSVDSRTRTRLKTRLYHSRSPESSGPSVTKQLLWTSVQSSHRSVVIIYTHTYI